MVRVFLLSFFGLALLTAATEIRAENLEQCSLGQAAFNARDFQNAIRHYSRCIEEGGLKPRTLAVAFRERGMAHARNNAPSPAFEDLSRSLSINPNDAEVWFERALVLYSRRVFPEAVDDLDRAIAADPNNAEFYSFRGLARKKLGQPEEALRDVHKSFQLGARFPGVIEDLVANGILAGFKGSSQVWMELPPGFVEAHRTQNAIQRLVQYVPRGESVANWGQMVTLHVGNVPQAYLDKLGRDAHRKYAHELKNKILGEYREACHGVRRPTDTTKTGEDGSFLYVEGRVFCEGADRSKIPSHIHVRRNGFIAIRVYVRGNTSISFQYEWQSNNKPTYHVVKSGLEKRVLEDMFQTIVLPGLPKGH